MAGKYGMKHYVTATLCIQCTYSSSQRVQTYNQKPELAAR